MAKKSSLLVAAASAILAFATPSTASATHATCPAGTVCPVGTSATLTGTAIALNTQFLGRLTCEALTLKAKVTQNSNGNVTAEGVSEEPPQIGCLINDEPPKQFKITTFKLTMLTANDTTGPAGTIRNGTVSFIAKVKLPSEAVCEFTGTNVPGHFVSGSYVLTSTDPEKDIPSTGGCGKAQLSGEFELEKTSKSSEKVVLD